MKEWYKKHKSEILVGIVVFLITTLLTSIARLLISTAPVAGKSLFIRFLNLIYHQAGRQSPYGLVSLLFSMLYGVFVSYLVVSIVRGIREAQNELNIEKVNQLSDSLEKKDKDTPGYENEIARAKKLLARTEARNPKAIKPRTYKTLLISFSIFISIYVFYIFTYEIVPATMCQSFELSVTRIEPYVEENEIKKLRSKWVSMETREDYLEIDRFIKEVKN